MKVADNGEADDNEADNEADADATSTVDATSTMMLSHNVTHDEEGSLAAAFDVQIQGCNNSEDEDAAGANDNNNNNNNNNGEFHVGIQDGYYYNNGTQVEEATTYPKPPQDYLPSDNNKSKLGEPSWHDVDNLGTWNQLDGRFTTRAWFLKKTHLHSPSGTPPVETSSPNKGKASFIWLSLGSIDALFFYQLLLPFHTDEEDEKQENEIQQKSFYSEVLKWSNNYANQSNTGKGHYVRRIKLSELVHFDGIVYLHRAVEGKKGSICYRWTMVDTLYSRKIATKMSWYWWRQIKSHLKLNCNHEAKYNRLLCKDDMSKFNFAYKFDYIYETLVHNVHYFSKKACSPDLCMDELSWAYYGLGGPMVDYLKGKMFSRGGQMVILSDVDRYVIPEIGKLWSSPPHLTADNFFNSDSILDWMLPKTVKDKYFHKENVSSASAKRCSLVARLCNLVTMVTEVPDRAESCRFTKGTGACNIGSVNSLDSNGFFMRQKEHQIDSAISRPNIGYKSWKYYHVPINHAKALIVPTAFDMYQEFTDDKAYPVETHATQRSYPVFNKAKAGAE
eukprot:jgi/Psemu1/47787/gm1.47787_g